mgnify:CR=1 FL=1
MYTLSKQAMIFEEKESQLEQKLNEIIKKWASWYDCSIFYSLYDHIFLH